MNNSRFKCHKLAGGFCGHAVDRKMFLAYRFYLIGSALKIKTHNLRIALWLAKMCFERFGNILAGGDNADAFVAAVWATSRNDVSIYDGNGYGAALNFLQSIG